jgi:hypothetical protein
MRCFYYIILFLLSLDFFGQCTVPISFSINLTPESCSGCCDGSAQITNVSGGCAPYAFVWSTMVNTQSITNLCAGTYTATVYDTGCCSAAIQICNIGSSTRIEVTSFLTNISFYPNPTSGSFTIQRSSSEACMIEIYDPQGKVILRRENVTDKTLDLDLSKQAEGIYLLRIQSNDDKMEIRRIVKN